MTAISLAVCSTLLFSGYAADIHAILTKGEEEDLQNIPIHLKDIEDVVAECKAAGDDTIEKFRDVNNLMQECMSKSQGKKQRTEAIKAEVDRLIAAGKVEKSKRGQLIREMEEKIDKLEEQEEEERRKYNDALDSMNG